MMNPAQIPLAERMRPKKFADLVDPDSGYSSLRKLYILIKSGGFGSVILWGTPGSGKTTVAHLIGAELSVPVTALSAVNHGVKEIRTAIELSEKDIGDGRGAHLMILDEIHRLNRSQQDSLLPALESGSIKLIGLTTENPSFAVNNAVLSRTIIFKLSPHTKESILKILQKSQRSRSVPGFDQTILEAIAQDSSGDARRALNTLSYLESLSQDEDAKKLITPETLHLVLPQSTRRYDKDQESHYAVASAFIKSIRASDANAAIYYLARMLDAGEDPKFIARRLCISASEDIGNADPFGLVLATAALTASLNIGMPEARIILAQATVYLANAKKSGASYRAINQAISDVKNLGDLPLPLHLINAVTAYDKTLGYGKGYAHPEKDPQAAARLTYLPDEIKDRNYF